ncbi:MAG: hypothetical protein IPK28_07680 [Devosia sp.]|nr:hypothetical protein [Devosia sp.]
MLWLASIIGICVLCLNAVSRTNETTDPGLSLALNPFNTEARVNAVTAALNGTEPVELEYLSGMARAAIGMSRADARGYSLLGAVQERAGDHAAAQMLYRLALEHSKTELHALLRLAEISLASSDIVGAIDNIDLILRRWPDYWSKVEAIFVAAAGDAATSTVLANKLDELPPWRGRAIALLSRAPTALGFVRNLMAAAPASVRAAPGWGAERDTVIGALATAKAYGDAYGLFLSSLRAEESELAAYVFDGGFTRPPSRSYFGWRVQRTGATDISLGPVARSGASGLRVRFLDSPVRPGMVSQNLLLPFGRYRLNVEASSMAAKTPKGLFWRVRCSEGLQLARLDVPQGNATRTTLELEFEVPASGCAVQTLSLDTDVMTDSWRDRYQGEVRFDTIAIIRL